VYAEADNDGLACEAQGCGACKKLNSLAILLEWMTESACTEKHRSIAERSLKMIIKRISISKINPAPYNPRKDLQPGDPEYQKLLKSLDEFDCVEPLVRNRRTGHLVC
jgi:hypothetical protein